MALALRFPSLFPLSLPFVFAIHPSMDLPGYRMYLSSEFCWDSLTAPLLYPLKFAGVVFEFPVTLATYYLLLSDFLSCNKVLSTAAAANLNCCVWPSPAYMLSLWACLETSRRFLLIHAPFTHICVGFFLPYPWFFWLTAFLPLSLAKIQILPLFDIFHV